MLNTVIVLAAVVLLVGLLFFEKNGELKGKLPTKTVLSGLFILTALLQPHPIPEYFYILLIGLIFCLGGDVFLALPQERMFLSRQNIAIQQRVVDMTQVQFESGNVSELDVQQAKTQLYATQSALPLLNISRLQDRNAIAVLLGTIPGKIEPLLTHARQP